LKIVRNYFLSRFPSPEELKKRELKYSARIKWIIIIIATLVVLGIVIPMLLFKDKFLNVIDSIFP